MYTLKKAEEQNIELIRQLAFEIWPQAYSSIISQEQIEYMLELMYSPGSIKKQMKEGAVFILLYEDAKPVGFTSFQQLTAEAFKLHKLYVLPSIQGKGAGKMLISYIEKQMLDKKSNILRLQVNKQNKAKGFYEKIGFTVVDEVVFNIGDGYVMDDFIMEKKLN